MEAIVGADFVIHTASPFTFKVIDINKDLIQPAVEGTSRMLEAIASSSTVKRVVLTSSFAAVVDPTKGPRAGYTYTGALIHGLTCVSLT
jgi:nucleoside-diphosphate-sugar epimerase